ncbi:MAG TPA: hypothetical protein DCR40_18770 [Prolixibacteraceae bacterium]|nr:hypothetical protein [Prolixibacteraceae bacterium]
MNSALFRYSFLFILLVGLCSWGEKAHRKINSSCVEFFPKELKHLKAWAVMLGDHGSDADKRKREDKTEFVRHFIDIDNYEDFNNKHRIVENFKMACRKYGKEKVKKEGTLPWATDSTYRALVQDLKLGDWNRAALTAANLGHYVGDGFMPLHIAANYDGQLTGQTGIHRRYEETMIDRNMGEIQFKNSTCRKIKGVQSYIFNYLYTNHSNIDLILHADSSAYEVAEKQYNEVYYKNLWDKTNIFTVRLLEESSKVTATLIYSAWVEAGKPKIPAIPGK